MQEKQSISNINNTCSSTSWIRGKCIGKGSFATVNLAKNTKTNNLFAVKSVPLNNNTQQLNSLESEIQLLKNISSPYIISYLDDDVTQTHRNLHLEYFPDGDIASRGAVNNIATIRHFTRCLLMALGYLHSKNIVHCDVKCKNVLLRDNQVKLADFGSAKKMADTKNAEFRGSPLWMAPEVVRGEYQGPESDVWSLGCTVIEMVKGKPAWDFLDFATLRRIMYDDDDDDELLPEIPEKFCGDGRDFLDKCLRRDKKERWSCEELLKHPFVREESPRCVFDWVGMDFDVLDDHVEVGEFDLGSGANLEFCGKDVKFSLKGEADLGFWGESAEGRIGKLATCGGANWENEGWVDVRSYSDEEDEGTSCSSDALCLGYLNFGGIPNEDNIRVFLGFDCFNEWTSIELSYMGWVEEEKKCVFSEFQNFEDNGEDGDGDLEGTECSGWECELDDVKKKFYNFYRSIILVLLLYCYCLMKPRCELLFLFWLFVYFLLHTCLLLASSIGFSLNYVVVGFKSKVIVLFNLTNND